MTVKKDGGKEGAEGKSSLHLSSFLVTLLPFMIILQKTQGFTGFLERGAENIIDSPQIVKGLSTKHNSENKSKIKVFSCNGDKKNILPIAGGLLVLRVQTAVFELKDHFQGKF